MFGRGDREKEADRPERRLLVHHYILNSLNSAYKWKEKGKIDPINHQIWIPKS